MTLMNFKQWSHSLRPSACLDQGQEEDEEDEGKGFTSKSVQPKLTTFRETMQSLDVAASLDNKGCTSISEAIYM